MTDGLIDVVRRALEEDAAGHDITTHATVPESARGRGRLIAGSACVISGLDAFVETFRALDPGIEAGVHEPNGARVRAGASIASVEGSLRAILAAERTALNFVRHLSGIATLTRAFVGAAGGVEVRDTRKTTPGLRALEKAAVRAGGGRNHRASLAEAILIKDNHIAVAGGIAESVARARATSPGAHVEVECDTLEQVAEALAAGADELLFDNMPLDTLAEAVRLVGGKARTEASGNVTLETIAAIAGTGVDSISVGALTHSAPAADLSLEVESF